jgi:hypothetical protein
MPTGLKLVILTRMVILRASKGGSLKKLKLIAKDSKMVLKNTVAMAANLNLERTSLIMTNLR